MWRLFTRVSAPAQAVTLEPGEERRGIETPLSNENQSYIFARFGHLPLCVDVKERHKYEACRVHLRHKTEDGESSAKGEHAAVAKAQWHPPAMITHQP